MSALPLRLGPVAPVDAAAARRSIARLEPLLVNQIAAGEVIERPASVVKELVENALDAGATRVVVELEGGGLERVVVVDDGLGIPGDELMLALEPHATSKVALAEDLDRIGTMGFRGEALASIASVSRMSLISRTRGGEAWAVRGSGSERHGPAPAAAPEGTRVEVAQLFFNTPARRKFLKSEATERARCQAWVADLAMAHPAVGFTLRHAGRELLSLPPGQAPRERALAILGKELAGQVVEVHVDRLDDARGVAMWGLAGLPSIARPTAAAQHVFLNGRVIRDRTVQHALREAYRGLIEPGRHPTAVLMIEMAPTAVDVNVHPSKLEVRFRDASAVHSAVLNGVRGAIAAADVTPDASAALRGHHRGHHAGQDDDPGRAPAPSFGPGRVGGSAQAFVERVRAMRAQAERLYRPVPSADDLRAAVAASRPSAWPLSEPGDNDPGQNDPDRSIPGFRGRFVQVHDSYIVAEDEAGLLLIDQHALHERVMFQALLERLGLTEAHESTHNPSRGPAHGPTHSPADHPIPRLESQRLLTPLAVPCEPSALEALPALAGLLERIGLDLAPLGPRTLGVHAAPTLLIERGVEPGAFALELVERAAAEGLSPSPEAALHEVLDMMACKAAIKAGQRLSDREILALLDQRERVERAGSCPHGRPTSVRLGLPQLAALFERR